MGKVASKRRSLKIKQRQKRKKELARLREKYSQSKGKSDKEKALEKLSKLAPYLAKEDFLAPLKSSKK